MIWKVLDVCMSIAAVFFTVLFVLWCTWHIMAYTKGILLG